MRTPMSMSSQPENVQAGHETDRAGQSTTDLPEQALTRSTGPEPPSWPAGGAPSEGHFPQPFGRYMLLERLGSGGMATVYRARDLMLDIDVALKVPHAHLIAKRAAVERFYREARAAARLCHPCLC